jgi:hypothetical protein
MTALTTCIPASHPADSSEVTSALNLAASLWKKGSHRDAIRWVRRAAEAADRAGDVSRMTALARAGADLEESLTPTSPITSSAPPPLPIGPASTVPPPPASASRMKPKTAPPPLPTQASRPAPPPSGRQETQARVRVSIKTSVRDPTLLIVRRLGEGKAPPAGTREGWLVMPESTSVDAAPSAGKSVR